MLVFTPFPSNHLNDFSNDLNSLAKTFGCLSQTIRMNPENHLDDLAGRMETKKKSIVKNHPEAI